MLIFGVAPVIGEVGAGVNPLFLSVLSGVAGGGLMLAGGALLLRHYSWALKNRLALLAFAAGSLLSLAFTEFLPEAFEANESVAGLTLLVSFCAFFITDLLFHPHFEQSAKGEHTIPVSWILIGWWFHYFLDGVALGIAFLNSFSTGLLVSLAMSVHKFLDGINASSLLMSPSRSPAQVNRFLAFLTLGTPAGALVSVLFPLPDSSTFLAARFAILAGLFIYISAADLLPQFHDKRESRMVILFVLGIATFVVIRLLLHE